MSALYDNRARGEMLTFPPVPLPLVKSPPWSMTIITRVGQFGKIYMTSSKECLVLTFRDNSVESRSSVSETVLSSAELTEVTSGLGDNIVV